MGEKGRGGREGDGGTRARQCLCGGGKRQRRWRREHGGSCWILAAAALKFGGRLPFNPQRLRRCPTPRPHRQSSLGWRGRDEVSQPSEDVGPCWSSVRACCAEIFRERALRRRARTSVPLPWATASRQARQHAASQSWRMEAQPLDMLEAATIVMAVPVTMPWCHIRGNEMGLASMGAWPTTRHEVSGTRPVMTYNCIPVFRVAGAGDVRCLSCCSARAL